MKKALAILMILALVGSAAFAEVSVGAWGRGIFVPAASSGTSDQDPGAGIGTSWSGVAPRIGFTVQGSSDNVGFQVDLNADGAFNTVDNPHALTYGDQQKIWVKPVSNVTVQVGRIFDDTLRGNACFGSFDWIRVSWTGEDFIFKRAIAQAGAEINATPVENLYTFVAFDALPDYTAAMFSNMQLGAGYTIEGIGQIRAQYIGDIATRKADGTADKTYGTINAAFKYTGMENLYVDAGIFMSTDDKYGMGKEKDINVYAKYKMDAITLHALAGFALQKAVGTDEKTAIEAGIGVDYAMDGGIGLSADFRYKDKYAAGNKDGMNAFFVGATKGFSNGLIGAGFEYTSTAFAPDYFDGTDDATKASWALPIRVEYWF